MIPILVRCNGSEGNIVLRNYMLLRALFKQKSIPWITFPSWVANSGATGVNDLPVAGQSRGVTEPQREGGPRKRWMRCCSE